MNVAAVLQGGVFRVLRTARAVFNAAEDSSSGSEDASAALTPADFSFSKDCDEERDVAQAWNAFSAAPASAAVQRTALDAFLAVFLLRCSAWTPSESGTLEKAAHARPRGCSAGHPLALLRALAQAVEEAATELACELEEGGHISELHAVHVRVFEAFRVVVRSRHNRAQLLSLHAFGSLSRCLSCLAHRLARQQGDGATGEPSLSSAATFLTVVSAVSALCAALEAELRVVGRPLRLASMSDVRLPSVDSYARAQRDDLLPSSAALLQTFDACTIEVLVRLVSEMRRARLNSPAGSDIPLEAPTLRCLAALLIEGPATGISAFRDVGGLETLLGGVGHPPSDAAHARSDLRAQLAVLEVCGAAVSADRESLRRAVSMGMFSRLLALLRWTGSAFSPELRTEQRLLAEPVSNELLTLVFDTMHTLCEGVSDEAGSRRTLAERTLLAIASAAFTPSEAPRWPELAVQALRFLEGLLSASPLAVATLRSAGADVALFGSAVFFWKPLVDQTGDAVVTESVLAARQMLRERAKSLLRAVAVAPAWSYGGVRVDLGIEPELNALFRALDACCTCGDDDGCAALGEVLCELEMAAHERFALASVALGAPVSLMNVITRLLAQHDATGDAAVSARAALLRAFEAMTACSATVRAFAAGNEFVSETLVTVLLMRHDDPYVERWALQQLQCIAHEAPAVLRRSSEPVACAEAASKLPLYRSLLRAVGRARKDRADLLPSLLALLRASADSGPVERLVLATERAHVVLVESLDSDGCRSPTMRTCVLHVAATLATLLSGCALARNKFACDLGYEAFANALERNPDALTPPLFRQLCFLICDLPGDPLECAALDTVPAHSFRHSGALPVFIRCLRRSELDLQLAGLRWLAAGLRASSAAQCCAAEAALPGLLLDWYGALSSAGVTDGDKSFTTLRAALTDALAVCLAVSAADIRAAFALLRRKDAPHRRQLLDALCAAAVAARDEPRAFFALPGGVESGIHLTLPLRWLPGRPVTFFLWLRVDELPDVETALLSLRGACGAGILISLSSTSVCATVCTAGAAYASQLQTRMPHALQPRLWQSVAVVLGSGGLGVFGGERARLYIDGAEVATARLRLPRMLSTTLLQLSAIGAAPTLDGSPVLPSFAGQVASPHIFDDALRVNTVWALHARGPELQLEAVPHASTLSADILRDAAERCVVAFSAAASSRTVATAGAGRTICYNVAPVMSLAIGEEARSGTAPAAVVGASTAVFVFRGVCDAFRALGGIVSALPLLDDTDDDFVASALRLAAEVAMVPKLDTELLTHALRRRGSRTPLSRSVFDTALYLESNSKEGDLTGESLVYDVAFWAMCGSDDACIAQAAFLSTATPATLLAHRRKASPLQIADAIAELRPNCCAFLRRAWLNIATTQMSTAAVATTSAEDALALAALAIGSPESALDATHALACALASQNASSRARAVAFAETGGCLLSLFAVHKFTAEAKPAALRLLTSLLSALPDSSRACDTPGMFGVLRHSFMSSAPSLDAISALLGFACLDPDFLLEDFGGSDTLVPEVAAPPLVVHPAAVGIVLQLLRSCSDQNLRLTTLATVTKWVELSVVNAGVVVSHHGWQAWLLQLLLSPELLPAQQSSENLPPLQLPLTEERVFIRRIFGALHAHSLLRFGGPGGGAEFDRTVTFAKLQATFTPPLGGSAAGANYRLASQTTLCEILADALDLALAPGMRWGPSVADNLSTLLFLVDELMPGAASVLPDDAGSTCASSDAPLTAGVWKLCSAACHVLVKLWPSLQAAAAISQAQVAAANVGPLTALSLRQRALTLLSWTGGDCTETAVERARAACDQAARFTLRLCMLYAREADADAARTHIDLLIPLLESACANKMMFDLFCSALSTTAMRVDAGRSAAVRNLLFAAAVTGKYLPAPAPVAPSQPSLEMNSAAAEALSKAISEQLSPELRNAAIDVETATVRATVVRRQAAVTALREELARHSASDSGAATATLDVARAAAAALNQNARARRSAAHAALEEYSAAQERRMRHALRSASGERGVWAPVVQAAAHWKVDKTEDSKRRRLRLRRDYRHGTYAGSIRALLNPVVLGEQQQADAARMAAMAGAVCLPDQLHETVLSIAEGAVASAEASTSLFENDAPPQAFVERDAENFTIAAGSATGDDLIWTTPATLVTVKRAVTGRLDIHRKHVHFEADPESSSDLIDDGSHARYQRRDARVHWRWPVSRLVAVHCQRYLLQSRALELFFDDRASAFLALQNRAAAVRAASAIIRVRPGLPLLDKRRKAEAAARAAERWRRREMSNFDYIMTLNTLAGRSYNDLAQYPVFPWVLADYVSEKLDLAAPGTLRDLTLPVGALNPARRAALVERFAVLAAENNSDMPPFHHGSHYSTPGGVLHWLIRLQPFTALHRALQGGHFDHSDRLFHSMPAAWSGAWNNASDVRELTPEFFCAPEFLLNGEGHDLGQRQDGQRVNHVTLPPWARGDPAAFVRANAAALECEAISATLHHWVDLVFGFAQRGPAAVEKLNVFYHLTYEGAVDLERVTDERSRAALADQIALFGQTPAQLFSRRHVQRDAVLWPPAALCASAHGTGTPHPLMLLADVTALPAERAALLSTGSAVFLSTSSDGRVLVVCDDGRMGSYRLIRPSPAAGAFTFSAALETGYTLVCDGASHSAGSNSATCSGHSLPPFAASIAISPACFTTLADARFLVSAPHWDARLRVLRLAAGDDVRVLQSLHAHTDVVTCVASSFSSAGSFCVTGSRDTTVCVWQLEAASPPAALSSFLGAAAPTAGAPVIYATTPMRAAPLFVLPGHDSAVSCVACSEELDMIVSACAGDSTIMIHALRSGRYMRSLDLPVDESPAQLLVSEACGSLLVLLQPALSSAALRSTLRAFNCNGLALGVAVADERLAAVTLTMDSRAVLTGGELGAIVMRDASSLQELARWSGTTTSLTALCAVADDAVLAGTRDGRLQLWGPEHGADLPRYSRA